MKLKAPLLALLMAAFAAPAFGQSAEVSRLDSILDQLRRGPVPFIGKQEGFQLVKANVPSAATQVSGGDYIFSQACTSYGTLNLRALGPDGSTYITLVSYTASDPAGGKGVTLGSYSQVVVTVSGTAGCNATLTRVP